MKFLIAILFFAFVSVSFAVSCETFECPNCADSISCGAHGCIWGYIGVNVKNESECICTEAQCDCVVPDCAAPPEACHYGNPDVDEYGCPTNCGALMCENSPNPPDAPVDPSAPHQCENIICGGPNSRRNLEGCTTNPAPVDEHGCPTGCPSYVCSGGGGGEGCECATASPSTATCSSDLKAQYECIGVETPSPFSSSAGAGAGDPTPVVEHSGSTTCEWVKRVCPIGIKIVLSGDVSSQQSNITALINTLFIQSSNKYEIDFSVEDGKTVIVIWITANNDASTSNIDTKTLTDTFTSELASNGITVESITSITGAASTITVSVFVMLFALLALLF